MRRVGGEREHSPAEAAILTPAGEAEAPPSAPLDPADGRWRMTLFAEVGYYEDWWIQILKALVIFAVVFQLVPVVLLAERKVLGRFQHRYGPNRVGLFGALQPMADIGKLLFKEQFRPNGAIGWMFALAPAISMFTAVATLAIVPFSDTVDIFGTQVGLYGIDPSIGILYAFAFGGIAFYGLMLGGWASGGKYAFLGSMRAAAQLISYEIAQGLALVGVVMMAGTLSLTEIVEYQEDHLWMFIPQFVGFIVFFVAGFAETNRPPFDLPEADAELVQGYSTEYGGGRFAAFYAAEYLNIIVVSALTDDAVPRRLEHPVRVDPPTWVDPIVVLVKTLFLVFIFIWVRATLPRLRYDQLMSLGWKIFLPLATVNALVTAILVVVDLMPYDPGPDVVEVVRAPKGGPVRGTYRAFGETLRGLKTDDGPLGRGHAHVPVPRGEDAGLPALPRPPQAAPVRGHRAGEVRRLLAVRRRLPGRLHPRRRRREHAREPGERRRALRRGLRDQPLALHLLRLLRGGVPVRRDHDGARLRDVRLQPLRPHLHEGDAAGGAARAHAAALGGRVASAPRMAEVFFFLAAIGALAGAIGTVALRNPFYSVLALVCHLLSLAALFLLLRAEFVAAAQVIVYVGAVMVLYLFVVAYVGGGADPISRAGSPSLRWASALFAGALFVELSIAILGTGLTALGEEGAGLLRRLRHAGGDRPAAADRLPARVRGRLDPAARRRRRRRDPRPPAHRPGGPARDLGRRPDAQRQPRPAHAAARRAR